MSRRRNNKKNADFKGLLMIGLAFILFIGIGLFSLEQNKNAIDRDKDSMCRKDGVIARDTAIIIDATDNFSTSQALLIKKEIQTILEDALLDEQFTIYILDDQFNNESNPKPAPLPTCNPGNGENKSELTNNVRRLKQRWDKDFYSKLYSSIDNLIGEHSANQSPIMEMLKYASINTMYQSKAKNKRIIIVSDMLHYTKQFSHYSKTPLYESFRKLPYALSVQPHLDNVEVEILYLVRPRDVNIQNRGHIDFWTKLISYNGGKISHVKTIN
mgnify:CR=1 FL=1